MQQKLDKYLTNSINMSDDGVYWYFDTISRSNLGILFFPTNETIDTECLPFSFIWAD